MVTITKMVPVWLTSILMYGLGILTIEIEALKKCPGKCTSNLTWCREKGGKIAGYCTRELACCDLKAKSIGSCGDSKSGMYSATFQSPDYPELLSGDLVCKFDFHLSPTVQGLSIEFEDSRMERSGFIPHSPCESDMIFLQGFQNWHPVPRCGNLTGYAAVLDQAAVHNMKTLTILAVMSSKFYKWKIKITQLSSDKKMIPKDNMGQITADSAAVINSVHSSTGTEKFPPMGTHQRKFPESPLVVRNQERWENPDYNTVESSSEDQDADENQIFEDPLVVNGKDTLIAEVPWQVSLRRFYPEDFLVSLNLSDVVNREKPNCSAADGMHFCGGAAHCFHGSSKTKDWTRIEHTKVVLGDTDLCSDDEKKYGKASKAYTVDKIMFHYAYDDLAIYNDMVVIKLKEKIKFNDYIKPIAISKKNMSYVGKSVKVSGWGMTNLTIQNAGLPMILQSTDQLFVEDQEECEAVTTRMFGASMDLVNAYPKYKGIFGSTLCTSYSMNKTFKAVGPGDSGGPLIQFDDEDDEPVQIGVVSYGVKARVALTEHDNEFVDFYQDVSYYRDWIDLAMLV